MLFTVTLWRDDDDQIIVECPAIPGCVSQGATEEDALNNIRLAIRECVSVRKEPGQPFTIEIRQVDVPV